MPIRLLPVALVITLVTLLALGALNDDDGAQGGSEGFDWNAPVSGVDSILDDALTEDTFGFLHDSVVGAGEGVEGSVDDVLD